ncbi:TonB-dependent receptor [Hyphococcus luteus]|uniref:Secretin/TonB short N-terminal domain-containing protein n=1 Tax=Hyphococcus luteus TaxID=2058213 RepID=A0A2S7K3W6_9PROT|nr:TonB-dependent receptor [Marinicaulis flavus]PQA87189.1 hypothetical protein CW354_14210 [Marinicaulis flavus]
MTFKNRLAVCVSAFALGVLPVAAHAEAPDNDAPQNGEQVKRRYDIPAQPLADALIVFSAQSGETILADPKLTAGRRSKTVRGEFAAPEALSRLLGDASLKARPGATRGFVVTANASAALLPVSAGARGFAGGEQPIETTDDDAGDRNASPARNGRPARRNRDEVVVTGTNIRGVAPDSSPSRTFTREDIEMTGAATAQDFIQTLPQNFGGGSNADIGGSLPNDFSAGANSGREGAYGSSVNLRGLGSGSTLVLLNGHRMAPSSGLGDFVDISLIPGSAIGRIEVLSDGASAIYGGDAVAGVVNFILRDDLDGIESSFRYGTVTEGDLDEYRASLAAGQNWSGGDAMIAYEFYDRDNLSAGDRAFSAAAPLPNDLFPSQRRHSVIAAGSQSLSPRVEIDGEAFFARRASVTNYTDTGYFVRAAPVASTLSLSAGAHVLLGGDWSADISGAYASTDSKIDVEGDFPRQKKIESGLSTIDAKASGALATIWGGDMKLAVGGHYREESFSNVHLDADIAGVEADRTVHALFGEIFIPLVGEENAVPGMRRLEINASGRFEDYSDFGSTATPKLGVLWAPTPSLRLRGSYGRSYKPPPLGRVGAVDFTAFAARTSDINGIFGLTPADPSIADVTAIYVSGTQNDLAPERSRSFTAGLDFDRQTGPHSFSVNGTYFDVRFEDRLGNTPVPGNRSVFDAPNIAYLAPDAFPAGTVVFSPSQSAIGMLLESVDAIRLRGDADPLDAEIISSVQVTRNLALTLARGVDFEAAYRFDSTIGAWSLGVSGSYLRDFQQQGASSSPVVERVDTLFNPVALRLRMRAGYAHRGFETNLFVNRSNGYRVDATPGAQAIDSWTTVDFSIAYDAGRNSSIPVLRGALLRLSAINLFDTPPPDAAGAPDFRIFGYDPTNASPLNRFIAIEFEKRF